jgi:hypothetical protein
MLEDEQQQLFGVRRSPPVSAEWSWNRYSGTDEAQVTMEVHDPIKRSPMVVSVQQVAPDEVSALLALMSPMWTQTHRYTGETLRLGLWRLMSSLGQDGWDVEIKGAGAPPSRS